jgi:hypothetical protein
MKITKAIKIFLEEHPKETKFTVIKHKKLVIYFFSKKYVEHGYLNQLN